MSDKLKINPYDTRAKDPYHEMKTILENYGKSKSEENCKKLSARFNDIKYQDRYIELFDIITNRNNPGREIKINYTKKFPDQDSKDEFIYEVILPILDKLDDPNLR